MAEQSLVKWDTDQLTQILRVLRQECDNLQGQREFLSGLKGDVASHWKSPAGTQYLARLDVDVENLDIILRGLTQHMEGLEGAVAKCYVPCEDKVKSGLSDLGRQLS